MKWYLDFYTKAILKKLIFSKINLKLESIVKNFINNKYIKAILNFNKEIYIFLSSTIQHIVEILNKQFKFSGERLKKWNINIGYYPISLKFNVAY